MIVLDTNVLSELMKVNPANRVESWLLSQPFNSIFITAITKAEILYGLLILPDGNRKNLLEKEAVNMFNVDFKNRILPFDEPAAAAWADITYKRRSAGKPISHFDGQIAAIARVNGAAVATRNLKDFEGCGLQLINPWNK
jgi:toxin FitB